MGIKRLSTRESESGDGCHGLSGTRGNGRGKGRVGDRRGVGDLGRDEGSGTGGGNRVGGGVRVVGRAERIPVGYGGGQ